MCVFESFPSRYSVVDPGSTKGPCPHTFQNRSGKTWPPKVVIQISSSMFLAPLSPPPCLPCHWIYYSHSLKGKVAHLACWNYQLKISIWETIIRLVYYNYQKSAMSAWFKQFCALIVNLFFLYCRCCILTL